ncbi:FtsX-like permease family protein [Aquimarina algiphila]|uniref:FtsX-like permease family protein n=1 Tax=Aquimarina algiphila TaxID=2047982 RepID=UPI00232DB38F|nr:FtsX-like permease family protein [Aquimarina algiphila]
MFKSYIKIAWRSLSKNKLYTILNIMGLGSGMAAAILVGLWLVDELSANHYHEDYTRIGLLHKNRQYNGSIFTEVSNPVPLGQELKNLFADDLDEVVVSSYGGERSLRIGDKTVIRRGLFMQEGGIDILGLNIIQGTLKRQLEPNTIYLSESANKALFGNQSGVGQVIRLDENVDVEVIGVFEDLPKNSTYKSISFYGSFQLFENLELWVKNSREDWGNNSFPIYIKIASGADMDLVSEKIKNTLYNVTKDISTPELFLHPMEKWHLYQEFKNGKAIGTGLKNVRLFAIIGVLILLLASINFMNLSTARSAKRAKEIGVRKAIGSSNRQLVKQFLIETYIMVILSVVIALVLARLFLPTFNTLTNDVIQIPWLHPIFISAIVVFTLAIGFLSGSYPALYLSSFKAVKALKGTKTYSKKESVLRKGLVVTQFAISIGLIICTVFIYQQIDLGKNRPMGYDQNNLIFFQKRSNELKGHFFAMRENLLNSGGIVEMSESSGPITEMWTMNSGFEWEGKNPESRDNFITLRVTPEFGKTTAWEILKGRDFSRDFSTDTEAIILNESAVEYMGFENPIDQMIRWEGVNYKVVGVCKNLVMESPFEKVKPTVFTMRKANLPFVTMRMNPDLSVSESRSRVTKVLQGFSPNGEFNIKFANEEFGLKLWREEQVAKLASSLSIMAIFISLLGIFGLSSFMAEQRNKEIGIRKILGASLKNIIRLMTADFMVLMILGCILAFPIAYIFIDNWLSKYELKINISWMIFMIVGFAAIIMVMLTVGIRSFKTANMNPIKSLRTE